MATKVINVKPKLYSLWNSTFVFYFLSHGLFTIALLYRLHFLRKFCKEMGYNVFVNKVLFAHVLHIFDVNSFRRMFRFCLVTFCFINLLWNFICFYYTRLILIGCSFKIICTSFTVSFERFLGHDDLKCWEFSAIYFNAILFLFTRSFTIRCNAII